MDDGAELRSVPQASCLRPLLHAGLLGLLGALYCAAGGEALVAQHAQGFNFRALAAAAAVFEHLDLAGPGHAVFVIPPRLFFLDFGPPQHQQFANVLDGRSAQLVAQGLVHGFARRAVVTQHADFDEAVRAQRCVGLFFNRIGQAVAANHHNGREVVGRSAVVFALGNCELNLGHRAIIGDEGRAMKVKTKSKKVNKAWLNDHVNDTYVKLAKHEGYRARAAYKLKEIDETLKLIRPGDLVVDLGSAPGAWSQYVRRKLSPTGAAVGELNGRIIALDLLPMEPVEGVVFIQGDFREDAVLHRAGGANAGAQSRLRGVRHGAQFVGH